MKNMESKGRKERKKGFTEEEKKVLHGASWKIALKRGCSSMYVRHIINGKRGVNSRLSQLIMQDLRDLLAFFAPLEKNDNEMWNNDDEAWEDNDDVW